MFSSLMLNFCKIPMNFFIFIINTVRYVALCKKALLMFSWFQEDLKVSNISWIACINCADIHKWTTWITITRWKFSWNTLSYPYFVNRTKKRCLTIRKEFVEINLTKKLNHLATIHKSPRKFALRLEAKISRVCLFKIVKVKTWLYII
jgi:hypothetical protein